MKQVVRRKPSWLFRRRTDLNLVDMHVHTDYSDANFGVKALIKKCLKKKIGVSVTDHNYVKGSVELCKSGVFSIPGIEVTCNENVDFLMYFYSVNDLQDFYDKHIKGNRVVPFAFDMCLLKWKAKQLFKKARDYNCLISVAHPDHYDTKNAIRFFQKNPSLLKEVDAVEGFNSFMSRKENLKSLEWGRKLKKGLTGGSDAHVLRAVGLAVTMTSGFTVDSFLDNIKKRRSSLRGKCVGNMAWMESVIVAARNAVLWKRRV